MQNALSFPKLSSSDVLEALGLELRRSTGRRILNGLGVAAAGALVGAGAVLVSTAIINRDHKGTHIPVHVNPSPPLAP